MIPTNENPNQDNTEQNLSGTPDETVETAETPKQPIWDSNNRLVEPELDAHFKEQADIVNGIKTVSDASQIDETADTSNLTENAVRGEINANTPYVSQQRKSQTADVTTSPQPETASYLAPTKISSGLDEDVRREDEELLEKAKAITEQQTAETADAEITSVINDSDANGDDKTDDSDEKSDLTDNPIDKPDESVESKPKTNGKSKTKTPETNETASETGDDRPF